MTPGMLSKLVVDATVVAKWFNNEELTHQAILIRDSFVQGSRMLCAPDHLICEVGNSIWNNPALGAEESVQAVKSLVDLDIELVRPDADMAARAMQAARELSISFYEALYVQLAVARNIPLVTANSELLSRSENALKWKCVHLRDI